MTVEFYEVLLRTKLAELETIGSDEEDSFLSQSPDDLEVPINKRLDFLQTAIISLSRTREFVQEMNQKMTEAISFVTELQQRQRQCYHLTPKFQA